MADTQGYEIVSELTEGVLKSILKAAWKSADDASGPGVIPEKMEIPSSTSIGPYQVKTGTVQIPKAGLDLDTLPADNALEVKMETLFHVEMDNPPIPSAKFFDLEAEVKIKAPVARLEPKEIGIDFSDLPDNPVSVNITSGDPVGDITDSAIEEYVHKQLRSDDFNNIIDGIEITYGVFSMKTRIELYDDETDPSKVAKVQKISGNEVKVIIPSYLRFYDISGSFSGYEPESPMGITGDVEMVADYSHSGGKVTANLSGADVSLTNISPADGEEGDHWTTNKNLASTYMSVDLEQKVKDAFASQASSYLQNMGDVEVIVPSVDEVEGFIEDQIVDELERRDHISIWQPNPPSSDGDEEVSISNVAPKVLDKGLAIAINAGSSTNIDALSFFVPSDRDFAIALSEKKVETELKEAVDEEYGDLPTMLDPVKGKDVKLKKLVLKLINHAIKAEGKVTIIDAIAGSIDVSASFGAKIGLKWKDASEGQIIDPFVKSKDVDLSLKAWIISFITGFITFGIVGGIIALVVMTIAENIAEKVGGKVIKDDVTGRLKGIGAWPQTLQGIGTIESRFQNPIEISKSGIVFAGSMEVYSTRSSALSEFADSNGPYHVDSAMAASFEGGSEKAKTSVYWDFDDGKSSAVRDPVHQYAKSGLYIAKLQVKVSDMGEVTTRHFAKVKVENAVPEVTVEVPDSVKEGEEFLLEGHFTDANWVDTHRAVIDWGDNTAPEDVEVQETHEKPQAQGTFQGCHAYCDNGSYQIKVRVFDDVGGVKEVQESIKVENVDPEVDLPEKRVSLVDQPIRLVGSFTDQGWCDTHTGLWDPGDCNVEDAIIRETNEEPAAKGTAEAVHYYRECGIHKAKLTVMDDDGGQGSDRMEVEAYRLKNNEMEAGFYLLESREIRQEVANFWHPAFSGETAMYHAAFDAAEIQRQVQFFAESEIFYYGDHAQGIRLRGRFLAGIYQFVPTNPGWSYEFLGHFHQSNPSNGTVWVGIDPLGQEQIEADSIVWRQSGGARQWKNARVRARAKHSKATLYLAVQGTSETESSVYFDRSVLYQIQPFDNGKACEETTVDFGNFEVESEMYEVFTHEKLSFKPLGERVYITSFGSPQDKNKLGFSGEGVEVIFPDYVNEAEIKVNNYGGKGLQLELLRDGQLLDRRSLPVRSGAKKFIIEQENFNGFRLFGGQGEASLVHVKLCL